MTGRGGWAAPGGSAVAAEVVDYNPANHIYALNQASAFGNTAGNYTVGNRFMPLRDYMCDGIDLAWRCNAGTATVRCTLWTEGGAVIATIDQAVTATTTLYAVDFSEAEDLAAYKGTKLLVSAWQTDKAGYYVKTMTTFTNPIMMGLDLIWYGCIFGGGAGSDNEVHPTSVTAAELFGVSPRLRIPLCRIATVSRITGGAGAVAAPSPSPATSRA